MITIKINGKPVSIKKYSQLTLSEYNELLKLIADKPTFNIFDYIAYLTGYKFDELMLQKVTNIDTLNKMLGELRMVKGASKEKIFAIEDLEMKKIFRYSHYLYTIDKVKMKSKLGYRAVIEQYMQSNPSYIELYTFTLAAVINEKHHNNFDYDSVLKIQEELQDYNAYDVLKCGSFFLSNLIAGERSALRYLRALKNILTRTKG